METPSSLAATTMIKTDKPAAQKKQYANSAENSDGRAGGEDDDSDEEADTKSKSLSDVWIFDSHLNRWFELNLPLYIQGSGAGKRIRKQFESRMAHSAVVLDQFVVLFGGLNKMTNSLISNDLYVLCLNGVTNALLPKEKAIEKKLPATKIKLAKAQSKDAPPTQSSIPGSQVTE